MEQELNGGHKIISFNQHKSEAKGKVRAGAGVPDSSPSLTKIKISDVMSWMDE